MALLQLLCILVLTIYIHELAHYRVALRYQMPVFEFSTGLGPTLYSWTDKYGTRCSVRMIPIGGYIAFDTNIISKPKHQALMILAGPLANFALAGLIVLVMWLLNTEFRGVPVASRLASSALTMPMRLVSSLLDPFTSAYWQTTFSKGNLVGIHDVIETKTVGYTLTEKLIDAAQLTFIINMLVGLFNLLPIPPLDGGRLLNIGVGQLLSVKRAAQVNGVLMAFGASYILMLMVSTVGADIWLLLQRIT